jgi:sugar/nucleoside kinase (ribokinase family)
MAGHVVSVGDLVLDVVLPVTLPVVGGQHQEPAFRRVEPGGAANFLFAARHMGLQVTAAGAVGADVFGQLILDALRDAEIDTAHIVAVPGSTSTLVIALADPASGQHAFIGHYGSGPDVPYPDGLDAALSNADALFVMGYTFAEKRIVPLALRALEQAKAIGLPVYLDVGPFMAAVPADLVAHITAQADVILMTEDEVALVCEGDTGDEAYARLLARGPHTLIVKQGASGCVIVTPDGQTRVPGYPAEVVDTIGAGDCFAGAFLAGRLNGLDLVDAAKLANAMGAATVQKAGAGSNAPTCAEVMDILARAGERLDFPCP